MTKKKRRRHHKQPEWYTAYGGRESLTKRVMECKEKVGSSSEGTESESKQFHNGLSCKSKPTKLPNISNSSLNLSVPEEEAELAPERNIDLEIEVEEEIEVNIPVHEEEQCDSLERGSELMESHKFTDYKFSHDHEDENNQYASRTDLDDPVISSFYLSDVDNSNNELGSISVCDLNNFRKRLNMTTSLSNFISIFSTTGSTKATARGYEFLKSVVNTIRPDLSMFSYRTVHDVLWPHIMNYCLPDSKLVDLKAPSKKISEEDNYNCASTVRMVLPSSWAKEDVLNPYLFEELTRNSDERDGPSIYDAPIMTQRENICSLEKIVPVLDNTNIYFARSTDHVMFPVGSITTEFDVHPWRHTSEKHQDRFIQGILGPIWMVNTNVNSSDKTGSVISKQVRNSFIPSELDLISLMGSGRSFALRNITTEKNLPGLKEKRERILLSIPGDICAFIRPHSVTGNKYPFWIHCILVANHRKTDSAFRDRENIFWVSLSKNRIIRLHNSCSVSGFPRLISKSKSNMELEMKSKRVPRYGMMCNGHRYVKYPILLYHDDFNPSSTLYPQGSVGGCYFIPLGLSPLTRKSSDSARIITLTPTGCSTVLALRYIVNDLTNGSINGIDGTDPSGKPIKIFLDTVGFVADYPASSPVLDVKSHTADSPCTCCSFTRRKNNIGSEYGYSIMINSRRLAYMRTSSRSNVLREEGISSLEGKQLGMRDGDQKIFGTSPFFNLQENLEKNKNLIQRTSEDVPITSFHFDPYSVVAIAPDHALMGISRSVMEAYFLCLPNSTSRAHVNHILCSNLSDNGLPKQQSVYNNSTKRLQSMTMSSVFCTLLVLNPVCDLFLPSSDRNKIVIKLVRVLQSIIANVYWWPRKDIDGSSKPYHFNPNSKHQPLISLVESFAEITDLLCSKFNDIGKYVDKPNLHRLVELVFHSIPTFGHARNIAEMPLETVHQVLKSALKGNTHPDKHITAMFHAICSSWKKTILMSYDSLCETKIKSEKYMRLRNLAYIFIGKEASGLDINILEHRKVFEILLKNLKDIFRNPMRNHLFSMESLNVTSSEHRRVWRAVGKGTSPLKIPIEIGKSLLSKIFLHTSTSHFIEYKYASFSASKSTMKKYRTYPFQVVTYKSMIQIIVTSESLFRKEVVTSSKKPITPSEIPFIFAICGIIGKAETENSWAICVQLTPQRESMIVTGHEAMEDNIYAILLTQTVRRVGYVHRCTSNCKISRGNRSVEHDSSIFTENSTFVALKRCDGFPPRMS